MSGVPSKQPEPDDPGDDASQIGFCCCFRPRRRQTPVASPENNNISTARPSSFDGEPVATPDPPDPQAVSAQRRTSRTSRPNTIVAERPSSGRRNSTRSRRNSTRSKAPDRESLELSRSPSAYASERGGLYTAYNDAEVQQLKLAQPAAARPKRGSAGGERPFSRRYSVAPPAGIHLEDPSSLPPLPPLPPLPLSRDELQTVLVLGSGPRSQQLARLDCSRRLTDRTEPMFSGGFSDVSQAKLDGHVVVAVKALRINAGLDQTRMRKRIAREIYAWAALDNPYVLKLLGFAFENGVPCLISPWCENGTLQDYLQKNQNPDRRRLVREIAEGLKYLHVQNIIHGDFKTTNVFITDDDRAQISDFGGSRRLGQTETGFTTTSAVPTTIRYSAPEILRDGQQHTKSSDVFSFAGVALETMTSQCPFWKVPVVVAVITLVVYEKRTPSQEDHPDLKDPALWRVLQLCWTYEPSGRPGMTLVCTMLDAAGYQLSEFSDLPEGST